MNRIFYLSGAYLVFWAATVLYLFSIDRRQRKVESELEKLSRSST
jgi:CcmD family protein